MRRKRLGVVAIAALVAVCFTGTPSQSIAEPPTPSADLTVSPGVNAQTAEVTEAISRFNAHEYEGTANVLREGALKATGPFAMRQEAAALLEQLKKTPPATP
jgi:hypothetical protein